MEDQLDGTKSNPKDCKVSEAGFPPRLLDQVRNREAVKLILLQLNGISWFMGQLLYGAGLRVMECVRLRVKDIDFGYGQIVGRDGKGKKDRVTILPEIIVDEFTGIYYPQQRYHQGRQLPFAASQLCHPFA